MGSPGYTKTAEVTPSDKFVTWLNGIDFKNDHEMLVSLRNIHSECAIRIDALEEAEAKDIDKAEAEGS